MMLIIKIDSLHLSANRLKAGILSRTDSEASCSKPLSPFAEYHPDSGILYVVKDLTIGQRCRETCLMVPIVLPKEPPLRLGLHHALPSLAHTSSNRLDRGITKAFRTGNGAIVLCSLPSTCI